MLATDVVRGLAGPVDDLIRNVATGAAEQVLPHLVLQVEIKSQVTEPKTIDVPTLVRKALEQGRGGRSAPITTQDVGAGRPPFLLRVVKPVVIVRTPTGQMIFAPAGLPTRDLRPWLIGGAVIVVGLSLYGAWSLVSGRMVKA